jgi:hypothetical protein
MSAGAVPVVGYVRCTLRGGLAPILPFLLQLADAPFEPFEAFEDLTRNAESEFVGLGDRGRQRRGRGRGGEG